MNTREASALSRDFQDIVGAENVMVSESDLLAYSYDAAVLEPVMPGIVVRPCSREELGQVIRLCSENGLIMTVRGGGTNLSGGTVPAAW